MCVCVCVCLCVCFKTLKSPLKFKVCKLFAAFVKYIDIMSQICNFLNRFLPGFVLVRYEKKMNLTYYASED